MKKRAMKRKLRAYKNGIKFSDLGIYIDPEGRMTLTFPERVKVESYDDQVFIFEKAPC